MKTCVFTRTYLKKLHELKSNDPRFAETENISKKKIKNIYFKKYILKNILYIIIKIILIINN